MEIGIIDTQQINAGLVNGRIGAIEGVSEEANSSMREYGIFKWKLRGTYRVEQMTDAQLKKFQPKSDHDYLSACVELRRVQAREKKLNAQVRRLKTIRDLVRTEVGYRKAKKCPCHILTGRKAGNVLCLARQRTWMNQFRGEEFYFWHCSYCRMGDNYKATKALMAKLSGEYMKNIVKTEAS